MTEQKDIWNNFAETENEDKNGQKSKKNNYKQQRSLKGECDTFIKRVSQEYEYKKIEFNTIK